MKRASAEQSHGGLPLTVRHCLLSAVEFCDEKRKGRKKKTLEVYFKRHSGKRSVPELIVSYRLVNIPATLGRPQMNSFNPQWVAKHNPFKHK